MPTVLGYSGWLKTNLCFKELQLHFLRLPEQKAKRRVKCSLEEVVFKAVFNVKPNLTLIYTLMDSELTGLTPQD